MSDKNVIITKINGWFSKQNIPMKVVEDTSKARLDALMAFKAATPVGDLKCEDLKTVDQLMITIEPAVEPGAAAVSIVDGVAEPLPPETYELEDGRKIVIIEAGIIDSVIEKTSDTPPADEPAVDDVELKETQNTVKQLTKRVEEITQYNATIEKRYAALEQKYTAVIEGLNAFKTDTKELFEEVFSEPGEEPTHKVKNPMLNKPVSEKRNVFKHKSKTE
ncbi:MAG: hypothetical protein ACRCYO_13360 [Bacteroidia bacterium]